MLRPTRKERGEKVGAGVPPMSLRHSSTSAKPATAFVVSRRSGMGLTSHVGKYTNSQR